MKVRCNRPGGFGLRHPDGTSIQIVHGVNTVDEDRFLAAMGHCDPRWAKAISTPKKRGQLPDLEPCEDDDETDSEPMSEMSAKEKIEAIKEVTSLEVLAALSDDEERSTVLAAIEKRLAELS